LNSELSLISLLGFEMLFDCFISRLYMRVLKLTLGKNNLCKFFPQFLSFQCEASGRPLLASRQVWLSWPDSSVTRPDARCSDGRMVRLYIQTSVTCPHVYEATCIRTRLMIRSDEDPTASIKHGRHIFSLPHKISPLALVSDFLRVFALFRSLLSFCSNLSHSRYSSNFILFSLV
jgi:hypothetical protein